jgi:hypothetical protein
MTTQTEKILTELTNERTEMEAVAAKDPTKVQLTLELTIPSGVEAGAYKEAVRETLQAFAAREIVARVWRLQFAPTRTTPSLGADPWISAEFT